MAPHIWPAALGMLGPTGTCVSPRLPGEEAPLLLPGNSAAPGEGGSMGAAPTRRRHTGWDQLLRLSWPEQRVTQVRPGTSPV